MLTVGLTGGIGSGKSTVASMFSERDIDVIDADRIAHDITGADQPCFQYIVEHFGDDILKESGELDRSKLQSVVFSNAEERQWLESLLHPLILQQLEKMRQASKLPYCILMVPLLIETGQQALVHRILVVDVDDNTQVQRAMKREHKSREKMREIMAAQATRRERLSYADDVIHNDADLSALEAQVERLHARYLKLSTQY